MHKYVLYVCMNTPLTTKQQRVYAELKKRMGHSGESPTLDELRTGLKLKSIRTVTQYLEILERKGYIFRRKNAKRNIELRDSEASMHQTMSVPS